MKHGLFEPHHIGHLEIKNHFVRASTWEGMASDKGEVTETLIALYKDLAKGAAGLLLTSFAYVNMQGKANPKMLGIDKDVLISSYLKLTKAVHDEGGKIAIQVAHGGSQCKVDTGMPMMAPSAVEERFTGNRPLEMSREDMRRLVDDFAEAGRRAKEAGFDGIELHAAHGYLLSQFLSPYSNRRTDRYGGSRQNRARIIFEVYEELRRKVGNEFPVMIKINVSDFDGVGLNSDDSSWVCRQLSEMGIDAIELSGGIPASGELFPIRTKIDRPEKEAYFRKEAEALQPHVKCPLILVGGLRSFEVIEDIHQSGTVQFFSLSRPLISEPDLIKRWMAGNRERARCISCNKCLVAAHKEGRLYCVVFENQ